MEHNENGFDEFDDPVVKAKANAARTWTVHANELLKQNGKPWLYLLVPQRCRDSSATLAGVKARFSLTPGFQTEINTGRAGVEPAATLARIQERSI